VHHGCLLVHDVNHSGDVSDWDPASTSFFNAGDALIFGVLPAVDGPVSVEVWDSRPPTVPEHLLFSERVRVTSGRIVVDDPDGNLFMETSVYSEEVEVTAYVDDVQWPENIALILTDR
jgi:hypothetical protein